MKRRRPVHVDQQQHPRALVDLVAGLRDLLDQRRASRPPPARHRGQRRGCARGWRAAAATMASAARPCVTTTTPTMGRRLRLGMVGDSRLVVFEASSMRPRRVYTRGAGLAALDVAVPDRNRGHVPQPAAQLDGQDHRAVPPAGAADGHRGVGLPLPLEGRQAQRQQLLGLGQEQLRSRGCRARTCCTGVVLARSAADSPSTKNGLGRKRTSSTMSASVGRPYLKPNDSTVTARVASLRP